jgi:hypothetical protein
MTNIELGFELELFKFWVMLVSGLDLGSMIFRRVKTTTRTGPIALSSSRPTTRINPIVLED